MPDIYYNYWGKSDDAGNYHLLVYHCLDVAAVANVYLDAHPALLNTFATDLRLAKDETKSLLLLLIALHDAGKFSSSFQNLIPNLFKQLNPDSFKSRSSINERHDSLGFVFGNYCLCKWLKKILLSSEEINIKPGLLALINASVGHHGTPVDSQNNKEQMNVFNHIDSEAIEAFYKVCQNLFLPKREIKLDRFKKEKDFKEGCQRVSWWLAGLTILSDWIGSNQKYFPYRKELIALNTYWQCIISSSLIRLLI